MFHSRIYTILFFGSLLALFLSSSVNASTNIVIRVTPPPQKEVVLPPRGYAQCDILPAGFYNGVWKVDRRVCKYPRGTWVSAYWQCNDLRLKSGTCKKWVWMPSHWKPSTVAYVVQPRPVPPPPSRVLITQPTPKPVYVVKTNPPPTVVKTPAHASVTTTQVTVTPAP